MLGVLSTGMRKSFHIEFIPQTDCGWSKLHLCFWVLWIPECYTHVSSHSTTGYTYKRYAPTLSLATENIFIYIYVVHCPPDWYIIMGHKSDKMWYKRILKLL